MTNPKDPWGQRPEDAPTEHLGPRGQSVSGGSAYTDDPTVAYGRGAPETSRYPSTEQTYTWTPPPPNATQQFPTHENQWGAYESGGGAYGSEYAGQWADASQPPGAAPPGYAPPGSNHPGSNHPGYAPAQPPPKRNTGLWIALVLGVIALVAVGGVAAGVLLGDKDSGSTNSAGTTTQNFPMPNRTPTGTAPSEPLLPSGLPGLPGLDGLGATMGTISANNGGTLTLSTLSGETVTVRTTARTQVISLSVSAAKDLPVGDVVMVQGDKSSDGSIEAKVIISTALPGRPR